MIIEFVKDCGKCKRPIRVSNVWPPIGVVMSWLAGFCSPACQSKDAYDRLSTSDVWWLKSPEPARAVTSLHMNGGMPTKEEE